MSWILIDDVIVEGIIQKYTGGVREFDSYDFELELKEFARTKLFDFSEALWKHYKDKENSVPSDKTLRKALNKAQKKDRGVFQDNVSLLNLLCFYGHGLGWSETLKKFNITNLRYRESIENAPEAKTGDKEQLNSNPLSSGSETNSQVSNFQTAKQTKRTSKYIQLLDSNFWDEYCLPPGDDRDKKVSRFYTHTDSNSVRYVIANDEIVDPLPIIEVKDADGNTEEKTYAQVLDTAKSQSFSLIKLVCDAGVGKTTLLFWLAHKFKDSYHFVYIEHIKEETAAEFINTVASLLTDSMPVVFLFDSVANAGISKLLREFINEIKRDLPFREIVFILAERTSRYNIQFEDETIERLFSGDIQLIDRISIDKSLVFEKVYDWLQKANQLHHDNTLEETCKTIFLSPSVLSISESTFLLIKNLKLNKNIKYDFDWEDWNEFIKNSPDYADLKDLFIIVATFYQFGIKLPITFKSSYLGKASRLTIAKAIISQGLERSPIQLADEHQYLILKHEHIAAWFLDEKGNAILAQGFFRDFIREIDSENSAKLIRKIRKASRFQDFKDSCIAQVFDPLTYLEVIDQYVSSPTISSEERMKMLTEKGIALLTLGSEFESDAITAFEDVIRDYPDNNHARDQLAKIYLKSPNTYQLALNKYFEIYNNNGLYAVIEIYKLLKKCKQEGIFLEFQPQINLSTETKNKLAKECLSVGDFDLTAEILRTIEPPSLETAECHNIFANLLKYTEANIGTKWKHYLKAIKINANLEQKYIGKKFEIDYAVFLYRIGEFPKSTKFIKKIYKEVSTQEAEYLREIYTKKIRSTTKLFIPISENIFDLKAFFLRECNKAKSYIGKNQTNIECISRGALILQTIGVHSKYILPEVYYDSLLRLAFCFMQHADKQWNNFSPRENREIAESYYDWVLYKRDFLEHRDLKNMLQNLLNFQEKEKSLKVLRIIRKNLENKKNKYIPLFYLFRGKAKQQLRDYVGAMNDYREAFECSKIYQYEDESYAENDMSLILIDMANLICEIMENKVLIHGFTLKSAMDYCDQVEDISPDFDKLEQTRERIRDLRSKGKSEDNMS